MKIKLSLILGLLLVAQTKACLELSEDEQIQYQRFEPTQDSLRKVYGSLLDAIQKHDTLKVNALLNHIYDKRLRYYFTLVYNNYDRRKYLIEAALAKACETKDSTILDRLTKEFFTETQRPLAEHVNFCGINVHRSLSLQDVEKKLLLSTMVKKYVQAEYDQYARWASDTRNQKSEQYRPTADKAGEILEQLNVQISNLQDQLKLTRKIQASQCASSSSAKRKAPDQNVGEEE